MENVVGGFCTMYCFLYLPLPNDPNQVLWLDKPFTAGLAADPLKILGENLYLLTGQNVNAKVTSMSDFRDYVKSFAKKNASHLSSPKT